MPTEPPVEQSPRAEFTQCDTAEDGKATGLVLVVGLEPGSYSLAFVSPTGYFTIQHAPGVEATYDSDADSNADASGTSDTFTLSTGEVNLSVDAGLVESYGGASQMSASTVSGGNSAPQRKTPRKPSRLESALREAFWVSSAQARQSKRAAISAWDLGDFFGGIAVH